MCAAYGALDRVWQSRNRIVLYFRCNDCTYFPCGIFDDPAVVAEMKQDAATIRKAHGPIRRVARNGRQLFARHERNDALLFPVSPSIVSVNVSNRPFSSRTRLVFFGGRLVEYKVLRYGGIGAQEL